MGCLFQRGVQQVVSIRFQKNIVPALRLLLVCWGLQSAPVFAIDNPDRPDPVAEFSGRAEVYEKQLADAPTDKDALAVYAQYELFLDRELNQAYAALIRQTRETRKQDLVRSQKSWLVFRDAEMRFIANNWTRQDFGSSATTARAGYRAALLKERVTALLNYLRSYPPGS